MKRSMLATTVALVWSTALFAADGSASTPTMPLRAVVPYLESHYQGEVVAIALDASGDKAAHYHVDMRFSGAGVSRIDVDAATLEIVARSQPLPEEGWTSLAGAAALAATQLHGQILTAELDTVDGAVAHYDIDVRVDNGTIARVKVDPKTRQLGWRTPPVIAD